MHTTYRNGTAWNRQAARRRGRGLLMAALLGLPLCAAAAQAPVPDALPEEEAKVVSLPPADGERLYVTDVVFPHMVDGRIHVYDGRSGKFLGEIDSGFAALGTPSADGRHYYLAATYYDRLVRGNRVDVVEIHDAATLALDAEVVIPSKHSQALPYRPLLAESGDGRFLLVQNGTPASSVTVVDLKERKFVAEIQTPGCWGVLAWPQAARFSTVCGDGTLMTVKLDDAGQAGEKSRSQKFFDPDADPVFIQPEASGTRRYFVSFQGEVLGVDLDGDAPSFDAPWPLSTAAERRQGWRPGGYGIATIHRDSNTLFVTMHDHGFEGSHKNPAKEVWAFDLTSHRRVGHIAAPGTFSIAASQGPHARLYLLDTEKSTIQVRAIDRHYAKVRTLSGVGDTAIFMELR